MESERAAGTKVWALRQYIDSHCRLVGSGSLQLLFVTISCFAVASCSALLDVHSCNTLFGTMLMLMLMVAVVG